jgi:hypothetical protein
MAQVVDERPYSGGLDLDSDERLIKPGDYVYGKNGRSGTSDQNYKGSVEGIRGNILRNTFADTMGQYPFPSGTNKIIGSIEDVKNQTIIYFLWNSNNLHRIIRYYLKEKVIRNVVPATWDTSALNFQRYNKIWNGKIVYAGEQDYIIWTDGVNPLRKIRLDIGSAYPLAPGVLVPQTIDFAKQPPQLAPTTSLVASTVNTFTAGKGFQFALRYVYDDNSITTLSPYSDIQFVDVVNRSIRVSFSSGHFTVKEIQILAREGNGISGEGNTNPTWYVVEKRTRPSGVSPTILTFNFTNTELKQPVARIDSDKLFESIPELAGCMELSETNQVIVADITEGKNNPAISNNTSGITLELDYTTNNPSSIEIDSFSISSPAIGLPVINTVYHPLSITQTLNSGIGYVVAGSPPDIYYSTLYAQPLFLDSLSLNTDITLTGGTYTSTIRVLLFIDGVVVDSQDQVYNVSGSPVTKTYTIGYSGQLLPTQKISVGLAYVSGTSPTTMTFTSGDIVSQAYFNENTITCFKENTKAFIGIQYYDKEMRSGGVIPLTEVNVTSINNLSPAITDYLYQPYIDAKIHNRPPSWAHYYSFVIKETNASFGWYISSAISIASNRTEITLSAQYETDFVPQKGDYFRQVGDTTAPFNPNTNNEITVFGYDAATRKLTLDGVINVSVNTVIEVYRQKPVVDFYFEQKMFSIGNPELSTRYHFADIQNQSPTNPTTTPARTYLYGDTYQRITNGVLLGYSKSYSSAFESDFWNKGRPAIQITNGGSKRLINGIRWGGQLFPNTFVNNMSVFDSGNYASTNQMFGVINAMRLRGFTLKIYQESNTSSAYLNRRSITNADGSEQLVLTDNLITQINPSISNQGTLHKGSVIMYGNSIYFFDAINGLMIRDAGNELFPISDYGAQKYFRDLAELTRTLGDDCDILSGFDEKTQQLFVSIVEHKDNYTTKSKTISFDEQSNRWKFFHDNAVTVGNNQQPIEMYSKMGNNMFMFLNGRCWESNELVDISGNPVYLKLFGEDREFIITGVSNIEPVKVKIFLAHSIHSNRTPNFVLIKTPVSAMYPLGMESELLPANYALREGVYYADIKRDAFTKGTPASPTARRQQIAGGRPIRGNSMTYKMTWNGNAYVVVFTSGITVIPSEKS